MNRNRVLKIKEKYLGKKIYIIGMDDSNGTDLAVHRYDGKEGIVSSVDDAGQLHGTWGSLALIPDVDEFDIID